MIESIGAHPELLQGQDRLALYQRNTMTTRHYFCSVCGIYTHHQRRRDPTTYTFNVACLDGVDPCGLEPVAVADGARTE
jgi:hypothetical protein